ncbi:N-acetyltransferase [Accumulibacter sp.]|uniref:GNAT family N-acetyltransferase n=1 Tax=Accumulibacter sp. TaxID=2053492 RepID=UPI0025DA0684|nr:N-acetyltransferase [Accumulibacter sp.]MCM8624783.1 N-acetyltransferase [Accumulibacter sp.]
MVAEAQGRIVGDVAICAVTLTDGPAGWYALGPVSVEPSMQRTGVGSELVRAGLQRLIELDAKGCVMLGDPAFYSRFGFAHQPELRDPGPSAGYFVALSFLPSRPQGQVRHHAAFTGEAQPLARADPLRQAPPGRSGP